MYLLRQEIQTLLEWHSKQRRKPLLIRGARQVGKTTLIRNFTEHANLDLIEINLERNPKYLKVFETFDPSEIVKNIELLSGRSFTIGKPLLFIDEIQQSPKAIQSLRYFYEEMPELPIVAAGSLLEFTLSTANFSMPVGRIEYMHMGPLEFSDYLLSQNESVLADYIESADLPELLSIADPVHNTLLDHLKNYFFIGGMPEAVAAFSEGAEPQDITAIHNSILATYRDDFGKYNTRLDRNKITLAFQTLPSLVGEQIKYSHISNQYKSSQVHEAIMQLRMARVVHLVRRSASNGVPLAAEATEKRFKTVFIDIGLVNATLGLRSSSFEDKDLTVVNKGALAEQYIGQHLAYMHEYFREPELFYWARDAKGASSEVDFVVNYGSQVIPVEVKAGKSGSLKSLHWILATKKLPLGVRFDANTPSFMKTGSLDASGKRVEYDLLSLPHYLVGQLHRLLN